MPQIKDLSFCLDQFEIKLNSAETPSPSRSLFVSRNWLHVKVESQRSCLLCHPNRVKTKLNQET